MHQQSANPRVLRNGHGTMHRVLPMKLMDFFAR